MLTFSKIPKRCKKVVQGVGGCKKVVGGGGSNFAMVWRLARASWLVLNRVACVPRTSGNPLCTRFAPSFHKCCPPLPRLIAHARWNARLTAQRAGLIDPRHRHLDGNCLRVDETRRKLILMSRTPRHPKRDRMSGWRRCLKTSTPTDYIGVTNAGEDTYDHAHWSTFLLCHSSNVRNLFHGGTSIRLTTPPPMWKQNSQGMTMYYCDLGTRTSRRCPRSNNQQIVRLLRWKGLPNPMTSLHASYLKVQSLHSLGGVSNGHRIRQNILTDEQRTDGWTKARWTDSGVTTNKALKGGKTIMDAHSIDVQRCFWCRGGI